MDPFVKERTCEYLLDLNLEKFVLMSSRDSQYYFFWPFAERDLDSRILFTASYSVSSPAFEMAIDNAPNEFLESFGGIHSPTLMSALDKSKNAPRQSDPSGWWLHADCL